MKLLARRGAFGMVVCELAPVAQPHVLLPLPRPQTLTPPVLFWNEDVLVPRSPGIYAFMASEVPPRAKDPVRERDLTPHDLRKLKEYEAARAEQPWGWASAMGLFGGNTGRVYMSTTGPRWRCCGNPFEDEHSPYCSVEGYTDPFPGLL